MERRGREWRCIIEAEREGKTRERSLRIWGEAVGGIKGLRWRKQERRREEERKIGRGRIAWKEVVLLIACWQVNLNGIYGFMNYMSCLDLCAVIVSQSPEFLMMLA